MGKARPKKVFNPSAKVDLGARTRPRTTPVQKKQGRKRSTASTLMHGALGATSSARPSTAGAQLIGSPVNPTEKTLVAGATLSEWGFSETANSTNPRPSTVGSPPRGTRLGHSKLDPLPRKSSASPSKTDEISKMINGKDIRPPIWGRRNALMGKPVKRRGEKEATYRIAPAQCSSSLSVRLEIAAPSPVTVSEYRN